MSRTAVLSTFDAQEREHSIRELEKAAVSTSTLILLPATQQSARERNCCPIE